MRSLIQFLMLVTAVAAALLTVTNAKKEKPLNPPFPKDAIDAIKCSLCSVLVKKTYHDVRTLFSASVETKVRVSEDDILTAIEEVCNPFAEAGQWIRKVAINYSAEVAPFLLGVEELPAYTKCKRTCTTVVEACEAIIDHGSMDQLTPQLMRLAEYADDEAFARLLCQTSPICTETKGLSAERYRELRALIKADVMEEIDPKELEIERMMDQMERKENRRHDIFTRDEVMEIQQAFLRGDREAVAKVDPSIRDLSKAEFAALQSMIREREMGPPEKTTGEQEELHEMNRRGNVYPNNDDAKAADNEEDGEDTAMGDDL